MSEITADALGAHPLRPDRERPYSEDLAYGDGRAVLDGHDLEAIRRDVCDVCGTCGRWVMAYRRILRRTDLHGWEVACQCGDSSDTDSTDTYVSVGMYGFEEEWATALAPYRERAQVVTTANTLNSLLALFDVPEEAILQSMKDARAACDDLIDRFEDRLPSMRVDVPAG